MLKLLIKIEIWVKMKIQLKNEILLVPKKIDRRRLVHFNAKCEWISITIVHTNSLSMQKRSQIAPYRCSWLNGFVVRPVTVFTTSHEAPADLTVLLDPNWTRSTLGSLAD